MRKTMKNIEDLIDTFENTGDYGNFFIGDYSNIEIATYIRQQKEEIKKLNNNWNIFEEMIKGDIDGFSTINEFGGCNEIIDLLEIYLEKIKELKGSD